MRNPVEDKGFTYWHREYRHGGPACLGCQRGAGVVLLAYPWLSQMVRIHPHCLPARSVPRQEGMESCCPCGICWKTWLQRLQTCTATASTIMVRRQDFNSSLCALLWLPAEPDLGSPLLQPAPRCCCPCSPTWGRASHTAPVGTGRRSNPGSITGHYTGSACALPAALQQGSQKDHLCPSLQVLAVSTPADAVSCSRTLPCSVQCNSARPRLAFQVRSWRQDAQSASRQSLPSSWEELHDKAG